MKSDYSIESLKKQIEDLRRRKKTNSIDIEMKINQLQKQILYYQKNNKNKN